jgi:threonine/homoserine/homoserine lactone efflux protein
LLREDTMLPWASFFTYIFLMAYTPGPNNIMSMNNAKNVGLKRGIIFNFGLLTGFFVVMILCLLFSTVLYSAVPKIQFPMKILCAVYMIYLIVKTLIPSEKKEIQNNSGSFLIGVFLQFINSKIIIYGITAFSSFILPYYSSIPVLIFFAFFLSFVGFTGSVCWALFGSVFSLMFEKHTRVLNIIMVILLLYCAISLFI